MRVNCGYNLLELIPEREGKQLFFCLCVLPTSWRESSITTATNEIMR